MMLSITSLAEEFTTAVEGPSLTTSPIRPSVSDQVYTRNRPLGIKNGNLNSAIGEELTMPYFNRCRLATVLILSLFGVLRPFAAALAGDPQETAPLGHNQTQLAP